MVKSIPTELIPEYQDKWNKLILNTEPADREKAEYLIAQIYTQFASQKPYIVWVDSPWNPIVRTAKIYESKIHTNVKDNPLVKGHSKKIDDRTFRQHQRRFIGTTYRRFLPTEWANIQFSLSRLTVDLNHIMWRTQHTGFYYGNHYADFAFFDWVRNGLGMTYETDTAALAIELAQCVAWWRPHSDMCFVSERPTKITFNNPTGPAIIWGNKNFYLIDRVEVPESVAIDPQSITINDIMSEPNAEVRRIMLYRHKSGIADFIKDAKAVRRDYDERYGTLWRIPAPKNAAGHKLWSDDLFFIEVVNRTPEPDSSFKHYFLRLPPFITTEKGMTRMLNTAKEAVAWTFNQPINDYNPLVES